MPKLHKSSTIDPRAQLAEDVEVGPGCVIEGPVVLGPGTVLIGHVWLVGPLTAGMSNIFYPNCCIGFDPQHRRYVAGTGAGVAIGNQNVLREGVTIHGSTCDQATRLGNQNMLMCNSHVGHDAVVGDNCTLANGALLGGHVTLGDDAFCGGNSAVHQFCHIGRLAMIGGGAVAIQDVPPFCTLHSSRAIGSLNIVGLRRAGYRKNIEHLNRLFEIFFQSRHSTPVALAAIERELSHDPLCMEFVQFVRTTKRGITHYGGNAGAAEE